MTELLELVLEHSKFSCIYLLMQTFRRLSQYAIKFLVYITQLISLQRLLGLEGGVARDDRQHHRRNFRRRT